MWSAMRPPSMLATAARAASCVLCVLLSFVLHPSPERWVLGSMGVSIIAISAVPRWLDRRARIPVDDRTWVRRCYTIGELLGIVAALALVAMGFVGVLLAILLVPLSAACLAMAWVRDPRRWALLTAALLACMVVTGIVWGLGQGNERPAAAFGGPALVIVGLVGLGLLRRRERGSVLDGDPARR
jgi:hypothetical protein